MRILALAILLGLLITNPAQAQPAAPNRAAVVIQYSDGQVETACVVFGEPEITSLDLLERAGVTLITQGSALGAAVCKIGPDGCNYPAEQCFCQRDGPRTTYWTLSTLEDGAWAYASLGASNLKVRDGDVHGWAWGVGASGSGAAPPLHPFATICEPLTAATSTGPVDTTSAVPSVAAPNGGPAELPTSAPPVETPASSSVPPQTATDWSSYGGFGAFVVLLLAGLALAARRRKR